MLQKLCALLLLLATLLIVLLISPISGSAVLISDMTMSVMVELSSRHPFCRMHTDRGDIQRMLLQSDQRRIRQVPRESVMELEDVCKNSGSYGREFRGGLGFIYPGTKWCGPGTAALDYNDLGLHADEDRCCREHDLCPNVLNVGECRRGLCNSGTFTRSHCDCDARLRRCLQSVNSETANTLGAIFYNVVQVTCFQERSPCSAHQRFEDFFYKTTQCDIEFRAADFYVPPNAGNLISKILAKPHAFTESIFHPTAKALQPPDFEGRALHEVQFNESEVPSFKAKLYQLTRRLGVKLASVGLAAVNIIREIVQSPHTVWESLHVPVRRDLPEDVKSNNIAGGYYYNMAASQPTRQQNVDNYMSSETPFSFWSG